MVYVDDTSKEGEITYVERVGGAKEPSAQPLDKQEDQANACGKTGLPR